MTAIVAHAPYTLNPCAVNPRARSFAQQAFCDDLQRLQEFPMALYNLHPGCHVGQGIAEGLDRLVEFLRPVGGTITVPLRHTTTVLGCYVCSHVIQETAHTIAAALTQAGLPVTYSQLASAMRSRLLQVSGRRFPDSLACFAQAAGAAQPLAEAVLDRFVAGMRSFNQQAGIPQEVGDAVLFSQTDLFLQSAQLLDWEEIQVNNSHHATKGGILEMALRTFHQSVEEGLFQRALDCRTGRPTPQLEQWVEEGARLISQRVAEHGGRLAG